MKTPRIIDVLGRLDDSMVNEALGYRPQAVCLREKRSRRLRAFAVAAAAVLLSLSLILLLGGI